MADHESLHDTLIKLLSDLDSTTGAAFFDQLVMSLCEIFDTDSAFIGLVDENEPHQLHTIAFCKDRKACTNISYGLSGTPCAEVVCGAALSIRSNLQQRFPTADLYRELGAESYIGIPLAAADGGIAGLVALLDRRGITDDKLVIETVQLLAGRIAAQIEHLHLESELQHNRLQLDECVRDSREAVNRANSELEAFNYSVSHDLRAPLRSIIGFSEALCEDCAEQLNDTAKGHLQRICKNAEHMDELINGLLILSRVTRQPIKRSSVDLSALSEEILTRFKKDQPEREVALSIQKDVIADGDPALLRIVMENLLANAWTFTGKTDSARISFTADSENGTCVYLVKDNGAGFKMEYADKMFEAFQRLHRKDDFYGIGMGLAIVKRIIDRHGGTIRAQGREGMGASFYFTLPEGGPVRSIT